MKEVCYLCSLYEQSKGRKFNSTLQELGGLKIKLEATHYDKYLKKVKKMLEKFENSNPNKY